MHVLLTVCVYANDGETENQHWPHPGPTPSMLYSMILFPATGDLASQQNVYRATTAERVNPHPIQQTTKQPRVWNPSNRDVVRYLPHKRRQIDRPGGKHGIIMCRAIVCPAGKYTSSTQEGITSSSTSHHKQLLFLSRTANQ